MTGAKKLTTNVMRYLLQKKKKEREHIKINRTKILLLWSDSIGAVLAITTMII